MRARTLLRAAFLPVSISMIMVMTGCGGGDESAPAADTTSGEPDARAVPASAEEVTGVEKFTPAEGKGNIQGTVLYNGKPAAGIEVTLCEEFNRFAGGCGGKSYTARTDENGEYVVRDVDPKEYGALLAKVFETDSYVFATTGIGISSEAYNVEAGRTLFVRPTNLFKSDLKVSSPRAGATVTAAGLALAWDAYPGASHYRFSLFPDSATVMSPYINERVDSNGFAVSKPLPPGEYRIEVEAYNASDIKLAESADDLKFTVR